MNSDQLPPVAVIGGSGFVGGELLRQLDADGQPAVNVDKRPPPAASPAPYRPADLTDAAGLTAALAGCDAAFFLAAEWRDDVRPVARYYEVNVDGARHFVEAACANGLKRCVFTSSVSIYGPTQFEVGEDHPPGPINHYGRSKLEAEAVLRAWADSDPQVSLVIVRPTVIFGPGNRGNVWNLLRQMAEGPFLMIGDGQNRKSMAFVENVAAFLRHAQALPPGTHVFNYADKPDYSMNELIGLVNARMGRDSSSSSFRFPRALALAGGKVFDVASLLLRRPFGITSERVFKFCANTQYAADAVRGTGFVAPVGLDDALTRTIAAEFGGKRSG